jgi:hypothetical protein
VELASCGFLTAQHLQHDSVAAQSVTQGTCNCARAAGLQLPSELKNGASWLHPSKRFIGYQLPAAVQVWSRIPADTDVLLTHGPPAGVLDTNMSGTSCGCPQLTKVMLDRLGGLLNYDAGHHVESSAGRLRRGASLLPMPHHLLYAEGFALATCCLLLAVCILLLGPKPYLLKGRARPHACSSWV